MKYYKLTIVIILFSLIRIIPVKGQNINDSIKKENPNLNQILNQHFEGQWFLAYRYKKIRKKETNQFRLKRGYLTFKHRFNDRFNVRFTQDITLDEEGEDAGNIEMRLKYCYLNINLDEFAFFYNPRIEVGLVHRPWLDFEQDINRYRVQGKMFLDKNDILSSADFGLTFRTLLGGEINDQYMERTGAKHKGKYGSFSIGLYNGGGYHALERNNSKTVESRITLRPFPQSIPGIEISYNTIFGKGNTELNPDYIVNSGFISYQSKHLTLTGQYYKGKGNMSGAFSDSLGTAYKNEGFSFFGEYKIPKSKFTIFARYDDFSTKNNSWLTNQTYIFGIGHYFYKNSKFIVDVERRIFKGVNIESPLFFEAAIEIKF
jgi:hypothetical protein